MRSVSKASSTVSRFRSTARRRGIGGVLTWKGVAQAARSAAVSPHGESSARTHHARVLGKLEIDHFHPQAAGGSDDIENLIYACTACNRFVCCPFRA